MHAKVGLGELEHRALQGSLPNLQADEGREGAIAPMDDALMCLAHPLGTAGGVLQSKVMKSPCTGGRIAHPSMCLHDPSRYIDTCKNRTFLIPPSIHASLSVALSITYQ